MSKMLNIDAITNDLEESAFFRQRKNGDPVLPVPPVREVPLVPPVLPVPPTKRVMKQRHPFDIYQDQYESLQSVALEERRQGRIGSMSALVREAIDKILAERKA
jgi:hypothetical protein